MVHNEESTTRELTKTQIYRFVANDTILDIADMLDPDGRRSKVSFTLVQFDVMGVETVLDELVGAELSDKAREFWQVSPVVPSQPPSWPTSRFHACTNIFRQRLDL